MTQRPFILAADIATKCGLVDGRVGDVPRIWTWDTRDAGPGRPARLAHFGDFLRNYFEEQREAQIVVDQVWYEAPLPAGVMVQLGNDEDTLAFLRGAIGVFETEAYRAGIKVEAIKNVRAQTIRNYVTGHAKFRERNEGKKAVFAVCRALGWPVENLDESDAAGVWAYACGFHNPKMVGITPMMQRQAISKFARSNA